MSRVGRVEKAGKFEGIGEGPTKGEKHVLYKKVVPKWRIDNPPINEVTMYLSTFEENKVNLAAILNDLNELDSEDLIKLRINSPGGLLNEGKSLINAFHDTGAFITTELMSDAASMAAIIFCIGNKRVIYENSTIMFHTFSSGYMGKGQEMEAYTKHSSKNNDAFFRAHIVGMSEEEIQKMTDGKDFWFNAKEMCKRGIATHVVVHGLSIPAKRYLKLLKKVKKEAKKAYPKERIRPKTLAEGLVYGIDALTPISEMQQEYIANTHQQLSELIGSYDDYDS